VTELREKHSPSPTTRQRPRVHFTATDGWINDPYGITWDGRQYHLFYQAIPGHVTWAPNCHWGHAVSPDLVHWRELPLALLPQDYEVGCWSGSFLYDDDGRPTILYTRIVGEDWGQGRVALAYGDESAVRWTTSASDTVISGPPPELHAHSFRDPFVWRSEGGWTMLMAAGLPDGSGAALQYRSADLKNWQYDGVLCSKPGDRGDGVWTGALWECPQLFPLGTDWVLLISVWDADVLHYVAAAVGDYDGRTFSPRTWQRLTYGQSAYAMTAFLDKAGRRCVMSWLREEPQNDPTLTGYAGAHSVVSLIALNEAGELTLTPHPDVRALASSTPVTRNRDGDMHLPVDSTLLLQLQHGLADAVDVSDDEGTRARIELITGGSAALIHRPGHPDHEISLSMLPSQTQILLDADLIEVFGGSGYGAYRIRPARGEQVVVRVHGSRPDAAGVRTLATSVSVDDGH